MAIKLKEALEKYNETHEPITQEQLAKLVGTSQSLTNKHLRGHIAPNPVFLKRYSEVLGVTMADLVFDDYDMQGLAS